MSGSPTTTSSREADETLNWVDEGPDWGAPFAEPTSFTSVIGSEAAFSLSFVSFVSSSGVCVCVCVCVCVTNLCLLPSSVQAMSSVSLWQLELVLRSYWLHILTVPFVWHGTLFWVGGIPMSCMHIKQDCDTKYLALCRAVSCASWVSLRRSISLCIARLPSWLPL